MIPHLTRKNNRNIIECCNNTHYGSHWPANKCALGLRTLVTTSDVTCTVVACNWSVFMSSMACRCRACCVLIHCHVLTLWSIDCEHCGGTWDGRVQHLKASRKLVWLVKDLQGTWTERGTMLRREHWAALLLSACPYQHAYSRLSCRCWRHFSFPSGKTLLQSFVVLLVV